MKRILFLSVLFCHVVGAGVAQTLSAGGVGIDSLSLERKGNNMEVRMTVRTNSLHVRSNEAVLLTPVLRHDADSLELRSIGIYGRRRYYYYVRQDESMLTGADELTYRSRKLPASVDYSDRTAYRDWMDDAELVLRQQDYGCCGSILAENATGLGAYRAPVPFEPVLVYVQPQVETVKMRALDRSAFVDFPVNVTEIRPDYRDNRTELGKIVATIDSVRSDADIRLTALSIKGFASPEGSYAANSRLAKGRTEALRRYVEGLYHFPDTFITVSFEPENWQGLRDFVEGSSLEHRTDILQLIDDTSLAPDARERKLRATYPQDYAYLLRVCYPALRRSDYHIEYVIRSYTDADEIVRVLQTRPQNLSLQEFYVAAQTMEAGSEAFNEVFETAVRMYPDDPVANLNAANTALQRGDLPAAARYLEKAGDSPQAVYARGVYAWKTKDKDTARRLWKEAQQAGLKEAEEALKESEE